MTSYTHSSAGLWAAAALTAAVGLGSLTSTAQAAPGLPRRIYDPDESGSVALKDMTEAQFDAAHAARKSSHLMVDIDVTNVNGQLRYAAVWNTKADNRPYAVVKDLTSAQFGDVWDDMDADGYMLVDQESYAEGTTQRYAGIFVKNVERTPWASRRNMTSDTFNEEHARYKGLGYMLVDFEVYKVGSVDQLSGIWVKYPQTVKWAFKRAMSAAAFATWLEGVEADYRLLDFESYRVGNEQRYGAIVIENSSDREWASQRDMTEKEFNDSSKQYADAGYRLIDFERYAYSSDTRYAGVWRQSTERPSWEHRAAVDTILDDALAADAIPGMSVAVMQNGEFLYMRGVGHRDVAAKELASSTTVFRIASVSKGIAGILALDLEESGSINLANLTSSYVPNLPATHTHTVAQTLTMRAGLGHYTTYGSRTRGPYTDAATPTQEIRNIAPIRNAGLYGYSTHSYMFSAYAMERAMSKDIFDIFEDDFRAPYSLGTLRPENLSVAVAERSRVYNSSSNSVTPDDITWKVLGGGLESSVVDLAALVDRIQRGQILTAANRERLWTPLTGATGYGMGFRLQRTNACTRDVGKDGAQLGANSYVLVYPELGVTVAVLTNRDGPHDARDVADDIGALIQSTECP
jgi:CubicO group peptidase (beta-lactamase class C family)